MGIITAMKCEAEKLLEQMSTAECSYTGGQSYYSGEIHGNKVVVCVCGVGKVFAAIASQTLITQFGCGHIINVGVAGSLSEDINIGDVVLADKVVQYDMDTSALGDPVGMVSGIDMTYFSCDNNKIAELVKAAVQTGISHFTGVIATGDRFFNDEEIRAYVANTFNAVAGEMEGAAVGQVCFVNSIPFNVVRIISDKAGKNSTSEYEINVKTAAEKLSNMIRVYFE